MFISIVPNVQNDQSLSQNYENSANVPYILQWKMGILLVKSVNYLPEISEISLPTLDNQKLLVDCLKRSPIKLVSIDPKLGISYINAWANACQKANKPIFLRMTINDQSTQKPLFRIIQRVIESFLAILLLIFFSPMFLVLITFNFFKSPVILFSYDWYVGENGQLFRKINLSTNMIYDVLPLPLRMSKYLLDNLFSLWNVIRGEIKLVGNQYISLENAVKNIL
ncbi:sugar transferase [Anabaena sp. FACHB-1237]|uniref:heterocyst development glycosyltransferase HepC n=1 Tax=Anabaena sp. FACHB-1237 TaxID=2692769 RepID=UPI00168191FE|nr:heterocyst development glycosyltransferase HepC [Anabaena sp. FACHB-1237]MBD2138024.1 sugar transferase [Anabaena sp. FACHB-1237]